MRSLPAVLLVLLVLLLSACGGEQGTATSPTPPATPTPAPTPSPTSAATEDPTGTDEPDGTSVVLEPDGLGAADGTGSIRSFAFYEADQTTVTEALETLLGSPTSEESGLECGPGPLDSASWEGLTTYFADGALTGWYLQEPAPGEITTADGIGLGTQRAELEASYGDLTVEESTIGIEFFSDAGLAGTLSGEGADATIEVVWAGETCIAR